MSKLFGFRGRPLSLAGFNRGVAFATGFGLSYSFANPDMDTVYEVFPTFSQRNYAFITLFAVSPEDDTRFEESVKNLLRYYQQQQGYLYTKLMKATNDSDAPYRYLNISSWLKNDDLKLANAKPTAKRLVAELPLQGKYKPVLYKVVVDDSEYIPPA